VDFEPRNALLLPETTTGSVAVAVKDHSPERTTGKGIVVGKRPTEKNE